jgi:hypothetical protein
MLRKLTARKGTRTAATISFFVRMADESVEPARKLGIDLATNGTKIGGPCMPKDADNESVNVLTDSAA